MRDFPTKTQKTDMTILPHIIDCILHYKRCERFSNKDPEQTDMTILPYIIDYMLHYKRCERFCNKDPEQTDMTILPHIIDCILHSWPLLIIMSPTVLLSDIILCQYWSRNLVRPLLGHFNTPNQYGQTYTDN